MNIIIADDEPLALIELRTLIKWEDYNIKIVGEARNGRSALELLRSNPGVDLAILDINMPGLTGLEVIKEWRKLEGNTEFLIISAYSDYPLVRNAFKIGITDYILKEELEPETLIPIINKISGIINKKKASLPFIPESDSFNEKKDMIEFLTSTSSKSTPSLLKTNKSIYRIFKLEILNCNKTNNDIKNSSLIYLTEQLLLKFYKENMVLEYNNSFYILIIYRNSKEPNKDLIVKVEKELKNTIKKYLNMAITISGGVSDLQLDDLQGEFKNLDKLHQLRSRGIVLSMDYIMKNYKNNELNMDDLCSITGVSRSHLSTLFKQETGLGYKEYLNEVRISHAITLLETTEMMIQEVCDQVGFSNVEHFSRTFKDRTGLSPSTFTRFSLEKH